MKDDSVSEGYRLEKEWAKRQNVMETRLLEEKLFGLSFAAC